MILYFKPVPPKRLTLISKYIPYDLLPEHKSILFSPGNNLFCYLIIQNGLMCNMEPRRVNDSEGIKEGNQDGTHT